MLRILTRGGSNTQPPCCALHRLLERRSGETGERRERRLRGVQPEPKVRVVVGRVSSPPDPLSLRARGTRLIVILQTRDVTAAVAPELRLDPVHGGAVAVGALAPIAEGRESLDGRLVTLQVEARDQLGYGVGGWGRVGLSHEGNRSHEGNEQNEERSTHESFPHD